mmetsp:Transcript_9449/g.14584  ORF Transcript_9449/g.14584 Transcript_9449/m.14584 type:complete len:349 (-) Transcript_9449:23-1069(-)
MTSLKIRTFIRSCRLRCTAAKRTGALRSLTVSNGDRKQVRSDNDHCVSVVQSRDREGYLCGLLMPSSARNEYFALRAFNAELAFIKDSSERRRYREGDDAVSSVGLQLRMQWWREALDEIFSKQNENFSSGKSYGKNPVVRALERAVRKSELTRRFLERMLDAREADLHIQQMKTIDNTIMYAEDSCSSLLYLLLECCNVRDDAADEVASNVGVAWGLVTAIRSAPYRAINKEMSIPSDVLTKPITADYLLARQDPDYQPNDTNEKNLREAVQHMAYLAAKHLSRATETQFDVPKSGRPVLLAAVPVVHYLMRLKEAEYNIFDPRLQPDESKLVIMAMLGRAWLTGRF